MFHHPFEVKLEPIQHRYFDKYKREYDSVSKFLSSFETPKDWDLLLNLSAKKKGLKPEELRKQWDFNRDSAAEIGTYIHNVLENYSKSGIILPQDFKYGEMVRGIHKYYDPYTKCFEEVCLFSEDHMLAGTADKLCLLKQKGNFIDIFDYKTNEAKGVQFENDYGDFLLEPLQHLADCNYHRYCLQLALYAYFIEHTWGYKVRKLGIIFIPPNDPDKFFQIPVPYMKQEISLMLKVREQQLLEA